MCGIAGIVDYEDNLAAKSDLIERMTETLRHRGPDESGTFAEAHALFGHRRLIVVDPSGGAQPMQRHFGGATYTIVYNGELYNTEELRGELLARGHRFEAYSDTEVLLHAFIEWGPDCAARLNGIFSFGIWNSLEESLFLCRDPLGVKPLYWAQRSGALIFASELKALLAHPGVSPEIDEDGICELIGLGPAHSLASGVFRGVNQLPAAHYLIRTREKTDVKEYWTLREEEHALTAEETAREIRALLFDAIERQLVADVPLCTFLSGGLDSSAISAIAACEFARMGKTLDTFSIEYQENQKFYKANDFQPTADDAFIEAMAEHIESRHHRVVLNNRDLALALADATRANDLPGMADIDSSLLLFCREVRERATVALSGECADEIFGGYPWYVRRDLAYADTFPWSGAVSERAALLSKERSGVKLRDYVQSQYDQALKSTPVSPDAPAEQKAFRQLFYLNVKWFMNTLLTRKDRMSMATSLEVRVPFADHRLVQYAYNIPRDMLFYGGREKGLLRKALEGVLPKPVLLRKKSPYPKTFHPQYVEAVCSMMDGFLCDRETRLGEILDLTAVRALVDSKGASFKRPWFGQLMTGPQLIAYLIQLEIWMREYRVTVLA
ncbi:MAG: asparagine synthase (glutamine-hydrolyzing) [Bacillota bacterium]